MPLSLLAAAALWRFASWEKPTRRWSLTIVAAFLIQMGFQSESMLSAWWPSKLLEVF